MPEVSVIEDAGVAAAAIDPRRSTLLAALAQEPASAASLAERLGLRRQQIGHHLRALEEQGLIIEVARRRHGGLTERVLAATAASYVVSPAVLGGAGADPDRVHDRLSAAYLIALAARAVVEVGALVRGAAAADKRLPALGLEAEVRFASPAARSAFAADLADAVLALAGRYHDESSPDGRSYRVVVLSHPSPPLESQNE